MKLGSFYMVLITVASACMSSSRNVICEDCKGLYEYDPSVQLISSDTLPIYREGCKNKMLVYGTVFQRDGVTPASDVIIYIYHTNEKGKYPTKGGEKGMAKQHGYNRGWVKTGIDGKYNFITCKPGHYPSGRDAAHIHVIVKEPDRQEYWIGDYLFESDPKLTQRRIESMKDRGGSGVVKLSQNEKGEWLCRRDIFLEKNIPGSE
ncbi:MAG: intradiol ring-cleavage dioxygenase [Cyclobacteriaceae bacterium]|nr:intradiol ring-cleavage dioxygenase [Cyclobacteriaceae bacterium]